MRRSPPPPPPPTRPPPLTPTTPCWASQKEKERLESQLRSKRLDSQQEKQASAQAQAMSQLKAAKEDAERAKEKAEQQTAMLKSQLKESTAREQKLQTQLLQASTQRRVAAPAQEGAAATETHHGRAAREMDPQRERELRSRELTHEQAVNAFEQQVQATKADFEAKAAKLKEVYDKMQAEKKLQEEAAVKLEERIKEVKARQAQQAHQQQQLDKRTEQLKRREDQQRAAAAAPTPTPAKRRRGEGDGGDGDGDGDGDGALRALLAQLGDLEKSSPDAVVDLLEGRMSAWLYSPCALQPMGGDRGAVSVQLSGCAAAALDELAARLSTVRWAEDLLRHLALLLVGRGRDAQLPASTLQGDLLVAHLFSRCCRARNEPGRLRVAAFELARHRSKAEPALLAALCCSWPDAMGLGALSDPTATGLGDVLGTLASRAPPQQHGDEGGSLNARARALLRTLGGEGWAGQPESVSAAMIDGLVARLGQAAAPEGDRTVEGCKSAAAFLLSEQVLEWCCALELLACSLGWNWTATQLVPRLVQLLQTEPNLEAHTAVLCLLGRIGQFAPSSKGAHWIRTNLTLVLKDADSVRKGQAAAFSLLEMDMAASPEAPAVEGEELQRLGAWLVNSTPSTTPRHVRSRGKAVYTAYKAAAQAR